MVIEQLCTMLTFNFNFSVPLPLIKPASGHCYNTTITFLFITVMGFPNTTLIVKKTPDFNQYLFVEHEIVKRCV